MAIGTAVKKGSSVCVYNEKGTQIATIGAGSTSQGGGLQGFTSKTVSVKKASVICIYNEKGVQIGTTSAR